MPDLPVLTLCHPRVASMPMPRSPALQELHRLDASSPDFQHQLNNVLRREECVQRASNLGKDDLAWFVDYLDTALDRLDPSSSASHMCVHELRNVCSARGILPTSYTIQPHLLNVGSFPFASGGYGDVYEGTLGGSKICIKRVRVYTQDVLHRAVKTFCKETVVWKRLKHPNIVHLLGITITPLQLVSDWMLGRDLPEYVKKHPDIDGLALLSDVAKGLSYLHSCNVIHGNLKGSNILVDSDGHARITDFCLATVTTDVDPELGTLLLRNHTLRWTAPEVLNGGKYSKEADIFSLAMVTIEIFTCDIPYSGVSSFMAMLAITQGKRPQRPTHPDFTENLWALIQRCWDEDPDSRPKASEIVQALLTLAPPAWKRLISPTLPTNERIQLIISIFSCHDEADVFKYPSGNDAQAFVDVVDEMLDRLESLIRKRCLRSLYKICGRQALLPKSLPIPLPYDPTETPQCYGGFADVWKGQHNGLVVAAKALRVYHANDLDRIKKRFCEEAMVWKTFRHPNVLPLLGVTMTWNRFVMVSEWMENGNINSFVKAYPGANRLKLLGDVARGLNYMHDQEIVHGGLKGSNILINNNGHACMSDFSVHTIISDRDSFLSTCEEGGAIPWMSPEILDPESFGLKKRRPTVESDCYALGMVIYEVLNGQAPFAPAKAPVLKILRGNRPVRPRGVQGASFTDGIWGTLELCWKPQPSERIDAKTVLLCLEGTPLPSRPTSPSMETSR